MNYRVEAKIITPVHVGAGQEKKLIRNIDFFYKDNKVILVDLPQIFKTLDQKEQATFLTMLSSGQTKKFGEYLLVTRKIDPFEFQIAQIESPYEPENEILPLTTIPSGNQRIPYLPGSSLKGAIRSVIIAHLHEQKNSANSRNIDPDERALLGPIENNLMSFIQVGDFRFEKSRIDRIKTFNLINEAGEYKAGWKHDRKRSGPKFENKGFLIYCETFVTNSESQGFIRIRKERFDFIKNKGVNPGHFSFFDNIKTLPDIFNLVNKHSRRYLLAEKKFFEHYEDDEGNTSLILQYIDKLLAQIPDNNNECLLHMSFGSGFHGITGNWKYPDDHSKVPFRQGKPQYKSRKLVFRNLKEKGLNFMPMGFLKLSIK